MVFCLPIPHFIKKRSEWLVYLIKSGIFAAVLIQQTTWPVTTVSHP